MIPARPSLSVTSCPPCRARLAPFAAILLCGLIVGCAARESSADLERQQDCGRQADQEFNKQNRYQLSVEDQSSSPFSSSGLIGVPNKGLNDEYRRDRLVDDCLHAAPENTPTIQPGRN